MSVGLFDAFGAELFRLRRRRSSWIALAATAAVGFLLALAPKVAEQAMSVAQQVGATGGGSGGTVSGFVYLASGLKGAAVLTGFFVALAAATSTAGEAAHGTLRLALARPVQRHHIFLSKVLALGVYLEILLLAGGLAALAGAALVGDFEAIAKFGLVKSTVGDMVWRSLFALALCELSLLGVLGLSMLAGVVLSGVGAALGTTLGFLVVSTMATIGVESLRPYFFSSFATSAFETLRAFGLGIDAPRPVWFGNPTLQDWADVTFSLSLPGSCACLFLLLAGAHFCRKDWLT